MGLWGRSPRGAQIAHTPVRSGPSGSRRRRVCAACPRALRAPTRSALPGSRRCAPRDFAALSELATAWWCEAMSRTTAIDRLTLTGTGTTIGGSLWPARLVSRAKVERTRAARDAKVLSTTSRPSHQRTTVGPAWWVRTSSGTATVVSRPSVVNSIAMPEGVPGTGWAASRSWAPAEWRGTRVQVQSRR